MGVMKKEYKECIEGAEEDIEVADHLLTQTYPLLKDSKLLLTVLSKINSAIEKTIEGAVVYERTYKRIPVFHNSVKARQRVFEEFITERYGISKRMVKTIETINRLSNAHRESPFEVSFKEDFVIFSDDFDIKKLSPDLLGSFLNDAGELLERVKEEVSKDEGLS